MHSPDDIDFIRISDITPMTEARVMIPLAETAIAVDVFRLLCKQADLGQAIEISSREENQNSEIPQAKVIDLPSKDLHGIWNS